MPSRLPPVYTRTIEVGQDFLPAPATRFVVTQYLETSQDPPYWALIIVGAFFDSEDRIVWSSEVFVAHLDIQLESDDDDDDDASESSIEEAALAAEHFARSPSPSFLLRPGRGTIRALAARTRCSAVTKLPLSRQVCVLITDSRPPAAWIAGLAIRDQSSESRQSTDYKRQKSLGRRTLRPTVNLALSTSLQNPCQHHSSGLQRRNRRQPSSQPPSSTSTPRRPGIRHAKDRSPATGKHLTTTSRTAGCIPGSRFPSEFLCRPS